MSAQILVVDDDAEIRASLQRNLSREGFGVLAAADGEQALHALRDRQPDLVVLDLTLPGVDGLEICRRLRRADPTLPVVMLTARDAVPDRVVGLEAGADDYLVKPFAFEELLARIRVCLRRRDPASESRELRFADLRLDTTSHEAWRGGRKMVLTPTEFELLHLLMRRPREVQTRERIYERVWGYDFAGESKVIEVYVRYLRDKLEANGESRLIQTIRGVGYVMREEP
ncbi:MAG: response regulator transcription factor [Chloroflexi bacterium]|nr:response regulator transcription factor [Chloroflexota bacterium]